MKQIIVFMFIIFSGCSTTVPNVATADQILNPNHESLDKKYSFIKPNAFEKYYIVDESEMKPRVPKCFRASSTGELIEIGNNRLQKIVYKGKVYKRHIYEYKDDGSCRE